MSAYIIILALIGPENHGSHFENSKPAFEAGASKEDVNSTKERENEIREFDMSSVGSAGDREKGIIELVETTRRVGKDSHV